MNCNTLNFKSLNDYSEMLFLISMQRYIEEFFEKKIKNLEISHLNKAIFNVEVSIYS